MESFCRVAGALARKGRGPAVGLAAFDLLWLEDHDITDVPDRDRRWLLDQLDLPGVTVLPGVAAEDVDLLVGCCGDLGVEGLVLTQLQAPYLAGKRSTSWRPAWRERHMAKRRPRR
jgi:ATP-dependent DNA ligase